MTRFVTSLATAATATLLLIGAASAQTPAATSPAPASKMAPAAKTDAKTDAKADTKAAKPRTAASLECSKQADAKGLHGDARRKFRSECKKDAKPN